MCNVAIVTGLAVKDVKSAVDNLCQAKEDAEVLMERIKALGKRLESPRSCKSYQSPYAKFDKIRRKRKWI